MLKTKTTKIEVRLTADEKLDWQTQADEENVSLSTLIRRRMKRLSIPIPSVRRELPAASEPEPIEPQSVEDEVGEGGLVDLELQLPDELLERVNALVESTEFTRDEVLPRLVDKYLAKVAA